MRKFAASWGRREGMRAGPEMPYLGMTVSGVERSSSFAMRELLSYFEAERDFSVDLVVLLEMN